MWLKGEKADSFSAHEEEQPGKQVKHKLLNLRSIIIFIILMVLTGFGVARFLPDSSGFYKSLKNGSIPKSSTIGKNSVSQCPLPFARVQQTDQIAKAGPSNTQLDSNMPNSPLSNGAPQIVQPKRVVYLPARDILSGNNSAVLQEQEEKNKVLEAEVKEKKLLSELKKVSGEIEIIPYQVTAQKKEISSKIAEKRNLQTVIMSDKDAVPPTLMSIHTVDGNTIASFISATGEHVDAMEGETAGEFTVKQIDHDRVLLEGKNGKKVRVAMKLPDRYPVSASMFASKTQGITSVVQPPAGQPMTYVPSQPVQVPISPIGGLR